MKADVWMKFTTDPNHITRIKRAELLSSVGAGVLGGGLALLVPQVLAPYVIPILLIGLLGHAFGMFQKHQLEQQDTGVRIWWMEALYWLCWVILVLMLAIMVIRQF